jgi:bifunctional DNA-binding transcriptional regulator/antitoxin component of YhaV-PrlF toxin-antitoxin module
VVIPKSCRDELGFIAGQAIRIRVEGSRLIIEPEAPAMRLERRGDIPVAVPEQPLPPLTAEHVRKLLERTRR